jgi:lipopolysaccharide/colanic/teichoic acid biosynthesis glycosyltransferase
MSPARPYDAVKRGLDIVAAVLVLVVGSPVFAVVSLLVARNLGRPVLFRQPRPGRGGRVFTLLKFRTMRENPPGRSLTDEERLTRFGRALRATSLDELPSFVNVLRGEMSVVGPRPLLVAYLERYNEHQARRHDVRPGITGLAQVSGRNTVEWDRRFDLDVEYVERRSLRLDAWILFRTLRTAVVREGISAEGHATMPEFLPEKRG